MPSNIDNSLIHPTCAALISLAETARRVGRTGIVYPFPIRVDFSRRESGIVL
jgi:hypothetical protein